MAQMDIETAVNLVEQGSRLVEAQREFARTLRLSGNGHDADVAETVLAFFETSLASYRAKLNGLRRLH